MAKTIFGYKIGTRTALLYVGIVFALVFFIWFLTGCDGKSDSGRGKPLPPNEKALCMRPEFEAKMQEMARTTGTWKVFKNTPQGAQIYSQVDVPDSALPVIDNAITFSINVQKAQSPNWTQGLTHSEWEIFFFTADGIAPIAQLPFLSVGGVASAGTIAFCNQTARPERNPLILPDFSGVNWNKPNDLFWYVFNEGEHFREYRNDRSVFAQFTGAGDSHPHRPIPDELQPRGLMSKPVPQIKCGFGVK